MDNWHLSNREWTLTAAIYTNKCSRVVSSVYCFFFFFLVCTSHFLLPHLFTRRNKALLHLRLKTRQGVGNFTNSLTLSVLRGHLWRLAPSLHCYIYCMYISGQSRKDDGHARAHGSSHLSLLWLTKNKTKKLYFLPGRPNVGNVHNDIETLSSHRYTPCATLCIARLLGLYIYLKYTAILHIFYHTEQDSDALHQTPLTNREVWIQHRCVSSLQI